MDFAQWEVIEDWEIACNSYACGAFVSKGSFEHRNRGLVFTAIKASLNRVRQQMEAPAQLHLVGPVSPGSRGSKHPFFGTARCGPAGEVDGHAIFPGA